MVAFSFLLDTMQILDASTIKAMQHKADPRKVTFILTFGWDLASSTCLPTYFE